jgi:GNAT superfamily N-acetyltransferase
VSAERLVPLVTVTDAPEPAVEAAIGGGLDRYNQAHSGMAHSRPLAVVVSHPETKQVLGGAIGRTSLGLLLIDLFFLPDELRGAGLGRRVLQLAEDEGRRRGCRTSVLYTISFQAPGFYARHGYRVFGEIPCDPPGTSRIFMTKALEPTRA